MGAPFSFIGAADCYIDVLTDTGERTGLELKGNCTAFVPKPDSQREEQTATGKTNYGQVLASVTLPKPMTAKISFNQLDQALFAAAFFGTNSVLTQAADPLVDHPVTTIEDRWVEIGKLKISNVVVENTAGSVTYVAGTDYEVNLTMGMIKAIKGGAIATGGDVHVSCSCAAITGTRMKAMTKSNVRIRVKIDGQNYADGREFIGDVYQMRLSPTTDFSLVGSGFVEASFEGSLETPVGYNEPMEFLWLS